MGSKENAQAAFLRRPGTSCAESFVAGGFHSCKGAAALDELADPEDCTLEDGV